MIMKELLAILADIQAGVLPNGLLDFAAYLLRRSFWIWFAIILVGAVLIVAR